MRQQRIASRARGLVGRFEIFQKHAPRRRVRCQVMNHEQQAAGDAGSACEVQHAQERAIGDMQARLRGDAAASIAVARISFG